MEIIYPQFVYRFVKYTGFEDNAQYTTLNDKTGKVLVKLSPPISFKDQDCAFRRCEINFRELEHKVKLIASQHAIKVDYVAPELMQELHQQEACILQNILAKLQILCCSTSNHERFNWRKFANEFKGISIEIDRPIFIKEFDIGGKIVKYKKSLPKIDFSKDLSFAETCENVYDIICTKLKRFKKENEFRFFTIEKSGIIELSSKCITKITLGCKMDNIVKEKTINFCRRALPDAKLYESRLHNGKVKIVELN